MKYADDAVLLSLLSGPSQQHRSALQEFVDWCDRSCLELNINKTKDMVVTFSNQRRVLATAVTPITHGEPVELVEEYKYLGTIFDSQLKFSANTEEILRKCHQRQYLLISSISLRISCQKYGLGLKIPFKKDTGEGLSMDLANAMQTKQNSAWRP